MCLDRSAPPLLNLIGTIKFYFYSSTILLTVCFSFPRRNDQRIGADHADHGPTVPETQRRMGATGIRRIDRRRPIATRVRAQGPL